jgi:hypothetical protein
MYQIERMELGPAVPGSAATVRQILRAAYLKCRSKKRWNDVVEDIARTKNVLRAARILFGKHGNTFTISGLCEESGLSRSAVRRAFPTKAKLLEALAQDAFQRSAPRSAQTKGLPNNDDWYDRRFRILERAINSLESQINDNTNRSADHVQVGPFPPTLPADSLGDQPAAEKQKPSDLSVPDEELGQVLPKQLESRTSQSDPSKGSLQTSEIVSITGHDATPPSLGDIDTLVPPVSDTIPAYSIDLPPLIDLDTSKSGAPTIPEIATEDGSVRPGTQDQPRSAVEPQVMRAILNNARSQVSKAAEIQAEQRLADTDGKNLTIYAAVAIVAVGLIVGVFTSYNHFRVGAKTVAKRDAAHHPSATGNTPTVTIINATGDDEPSAEQPTRWFKSLAAKAARGDVRSQSKLALAYLKGDGTGANPAAALGWSQMAAAQGDTSAQFLLATIYASGIKPDLSLAVRWFAAAASGGNLKAMHNLALAYLNGSGVSQDTSAALTWFSKAASSGYTDSAFDLAVLYERGQAVPQNSRLALYWYTVAASQGDHEATQRLELLKAATSKIVSNK